MTWCELQQWMYVMLFFFSLSAAACPIEIQAKKKNDTEEGGLLLKRWSFHRLVSYDVSLFFSLHAIAYIVFFFLWIFPPILVASNQHSYTRVLFAIFVVHIFRKLHRTIPRYLFKQRTSTNHNHHYRRAHHHRHQMVKKNLQRHTYTYTNRLWICHTYH